VRFGYPSAGVSSASRIRSRELAAARNFREASREKATLKQHCDALEDKVKALEQSLSETVELATARKERKETESSERDEALAAAASRAAAAEAELAELRAELALATENHEWLRRALEARTAANAAAETQRQALSARVVELERIVDESEAHLSEVQTEREAQKMKYKKRVAAATAQRLAAEATNAMLKGEMARMRAQMDTRRLGGGVLEDVTNRAAIRMSKLQVHTTPGARVSEPSAMASPSCAKDDSAMGCVGPVEDGSESVSKPAGKRDRRALVSRRGDGVSSARRRRRVSPPTSRASRRKRPGQSHRRRASSRARISPLTWARSRWYPRVSSRVSPQV